MGKVKYDQMLLLVEKIKIMILFILPMSMLVGMQVVALPATASAEDCVNGITNVDSCQSIGSRAVGEEDDFEGDCTDPNIEESNCGIIRYLIVIVNALSALVGLVIVGSIIVGGIQYSSAGSDPQKVQAAKNRIRNAIIALLFYLFGYAFLNFLIPGGLL